jgi:hypothetical protein
MALLNCRQSEGRVGIEGHSSSYLARFRGRTGFDIGTREMAVARGEVTWEQGLNRQETLGYKQLDS